MKRLLEYLYIIIGLGLIFSTTTFAIPMKNNGQGDLVLSDKILEKFYFYVTTKPQNNPVNFFITEDLNNVFIEIRKDTTYKGYSGSGPIARNLKKCEQKYKQKCFLFSNQRIIVWNNGINPIDVKKSKIKRKISYDEFIVRLKDLGFYKDEKTVIAKAESSQTQKVAKEKSENLYVERILTKQEKLDFEKGKIKIYKCSTSTGTHLQKDDCIGDYYKKKLLPKSLWNAYLFRDYTKTQTAKSEPKKKENKKVAKVKEVKTKDYKKIIVEEKKTQSAKKQTNLVKNKKVKDSQGVSPKQEKFVPKEIDQDNDPPIIKIASNITVNDASYEFQGKITDKAKLVFVEVDGRSVEVLNGNFTVKGYSPIDKKISIEAIDQWGNRSEPKIVKLTIDIKDTSIAEKLDPLNPSKIVTESSSSKVALIIGIENYSDIVNASYAKADAQYFKEYASKGLGIENKNIKLLLDEGATFIKINKALKKWLVSKIKPNKTELIIYYAGHGLASKDGKELYLLPQDGDPDLLSISSISRTNLFSEIKGLNPKSVTIFLDACYSGSSRDQEILLADARPVRIVADEQEGIPDNFTIFSASQLDQISSGLKEANHGIFSYFLMKGLIIFLSREISVIRVS